jgi:hypothetical protein
MGGVEEDTMSLEQRGVFAGEPFFAMMNLLVSDVFPDVAVLEWRNGKGSVPVLPPEVAPVRKGVMNPFRGSCLYAGYQLGERDRAGRLEVQVNVIPHSTGA